MKTEELEKIGLNKEQVSAVMKINGMDIEELKKENGTLKTENTTLTAERDEYKGLYDTAAETLKGFEGKDFDAIQKDRDEWKEKAEQAELNFDNRMKEQEKEKAVDEFMESLNFSSEYAKRAFKEDLQKADLPVRDGKLLGASDFMSNYDKAAFVDEKTVEAEKRRSHIVGTPMHQGAGSKLSTAELMKMKNENPDMDITPYLKG